MSDNNEITYKVHWQAEDTHPEVIDAFRASMKEVIDPEIGLDVIELGLIRDLEMEDQSAKVTMILTTPFCPYGPAMLEMSRRKAEEALHLPVIIEMGMEMWDLSMMEEGAGADWGLF